MDIAYDFMQKPDDRYVNPESLAWNLVMDNDIDNFAAVIQKFVTNDQGEYGANRYEQLADEFQILITIYMEMIFTIMKSNHMAELLDDNCDIDEGVDLDTELNNYIPDFRMYSTDYMTAFFRDKFAKIRYFLSVRDLTDYCSHDPNDFGYETDYYCKILLMDDRRSSTMKYFQQATHVPDGKRYTFLMRRDINEQKQKELKDFYAIVYLPYHNDDPEHRPRKLRIAFEKYNVISSDPHMSA